MNALPVGVNVMQSFGSHDDVPSFINERMKKLGIPSYRQLAALSGVNHVSLLLGLKRERELTLSNAQKIALALGLSLDELFVAISER